MKFHQVAWCSTCLLAVPASASSQSEAFPPLHGTKSDPIVQVAPLVVAMACRDGVAIVAAHPSSDSEPLLFYNSEEEEEAIASEDSIAKKEDENSDDHDNVFLDLPLSYSGPLRIQSVGTVGTALVACGWRADGSGRLLDMAREFADAERQTFGEESSSILPSQLSLYMAKCAVSERVRALSCAALVAYGDALRCGAADSAPGCLWLVDVTGAYPVRAHCMGGGLSTRTAKTGDDASSTVFVSDVVNRKLLELLRNEQASGKERRPYFDMTTEEGLETLLGLLSVNRKEGSGESSLHGPLLQPGARLELAKVDAPQQRIVRKRVSDIWGSKQMPSL